MARHKANGRALRRPGIWRCFRVAKKSKLQKSHVRRIFLPGFVSGSAGRPLHCDWLLGKGRCGSVLTRPRLDFNRSFLSWDDIIKVFIKVIIIKVIHQSDHHPSDSSKWSLSKWFIKVIIIQVIHQSDRHPSDSSKWSSSKWFIKVIVIQVIHQSDRHPSDLKVYQEACWYTGDYWAGL